MPGHVAPTPAEVHLWRAPLDLDADVLASLARPLSTSEHERARRLHFERDRALWTAARGWLRLLLARYLDADAADLQFQQDALGKPRLAAPSPWLRFSVSHSADTVVFAVARGREVGVDVEQVRTDFSMEPVMRRFFSSDERAALALLPVERQTAAAFQCWTRKEAYAKALGVGLAALDEAGWGGLGVESAAWSAAAQRRWRLHAFDAGAGYAAAVAVEGPDAQVPSVASVLGLDAGS